MEAERVMRRHRSKDATADAAGAVSASTGVIANRDDAIALMQRAAFDPALYPDTLAFVDPVTGAAKPCWAGQKFDVVDLDPYGSAAPFIDSAIASAREGALLLVTSTDSAVLCGNYSETCHAKYGSTGIKTVACHEMAVRILLAALERAAARQGKSIVPLVSLHIDFYIRVFVRVYTSAADAKMACCKLGLMVQCAQCPNHYAMPLSRPRGGRSKAQEANKPAPPAAAKGAPPVPPQNFPAAPARSDNATNLQCESWGDYVPGSACECCGGRLLVGGPLYCAPTQDRAFITQLLAEIEARGPERLKGQARIKGMLVTAASELPEVPLFYSLPELSSRLKMHCPPAPIITAALARLGYRCSQAHSDAVGFKTDAPCRVLLGLLLRHKANTPESPGHEQPDGVVVVPAPFAGRVEPLAAEQCDFTYDVAYDMRGAVTGVAKFVVNAPFWGPRARHRGALRHDRDEEEEQETQEGGAPA
jgi:tRNA (guanine26-N2/guanine27-N2)-dimethyltransferase